MKALMRTISLLAMCFVLLLLVSLPRPESAPRSGPGEIRILLMMGDRVGGYHYFTRDVWEQYGWSLTSAGLMPELDPCTLGVPMDVDTLITEVTDLSGYDCLAIMQTLAWQGDSHDDILASPEALALVQQAVSEGLLVVASCGAVRVLAAANVIDGFDVTGRPQGALSAARLDSGGDHRIAMSAAVLGLVADGDTVIDDADCVATSFPRFADTLRALGAEVELS